MLALEDAVGNFDFILHFAVDANWHSIQCKYFFLCVYILYLFPDENFSLFLCTLYTTLSLSRLKTHNNIAI